MHRKKIRTLVLVGGFMAGGFLFGSTASAEGPTAAMLANTCAGCHGTNGVSGGPAMPSIAGFPATYFKAIMKEFKDGTRPSTIMGRLAKGYSDEEIALIADFFAKTKWSSANGHANSKNATVVDTALAAKGKKLATDSKCDKCHEDDGVFQDEDTPRVAGQWLDYLIIKMRDYRNPDMKVPQQKKMETAMEKLSLDDLLAVAHFYASNKK
ncbi:MAG: sulfide dehydrogenase (flavocytochrome), cytochrome c subunit [Magnetococcales bacterium]|nr:sulfide dehydrogenase (flavocytochrome), cytochrome c subunit [Magnetococcales bacterium]HIJ83913.1 cytochrome c4 [Magnetococcales bacterium]